MSEAALSGGEIAELAGRRWSFGSAVLDERSLELQVDGKYVELERKPLEVLLYLLHHAGEVVTKDDLVENLWPGRLLTDTVLSRCISVLRQALRDDERMLIRTVHGFGYRLVGQVKVEASAAPAAPAVDLKVGDCPPLRPQWKLVERLGAGGHGEAWLARHDKTGDARVFKFAVDAAALSSLKREITLYRLLHDSLGARAAIVRILEWNFQEVPYFIEMEYVPGGNLQSWADAQGGLAAVPLATRLELVAQIADAVAAAHSVGALHKDLKPGNVLIRVEDGKPVIRLCDFGSGGVLDPKRLEALGITRLGFTKTMGQATSATPLYLAPEVIAGQPFSVQADIYSLGVLLYQMIAGDLRRPMAPGWELDIDDELLREDVALVAAGNPTRRLADATQLSEKLRGLGTRRQARAAERAAAQRAELARRVTQELYQTRVAAGLLILLSATAAGVGWVAYKAREAALEAEASARAVNTFLTEDVLRVDTVERPQVDSYKSSLDRAASMVGNRFPDHPEAAASIHWLLGRRYQEIEQAGAAIEQYELATALYEQMDGPTAPDTLVGKERLASMYVDHGRGVEALAIARTLRSYWIARPGLEALLWRARAGRIMALAGNADAAEREFRDVLSRIPASVDLDPEATARIFKQWVGYSPKVLADMRDSVLAHVNDMLSATLGEMQGRFSEAEEKASDALATLTRIVGGDSEQVAFVRVRLGAIRLEIGKYPEAEADLLRALAFYDRWLPQTHLYRGIPRAWLGRLRLEQRRPAEALALFEEADRHCATTCPLRFKGAYTTGIGEAHWQLGNVDKAIAALRSAIAISDSLKGLHHISTEAPRISLATIFLERGEMDAARATLSGVALETVAAFPNNGLTARVRRIQGLLAEAEGDLPRATTALEEAHTILERLLGQNHWRTRDARAELARVRPKYP